MHGSQYSTRVPWSSGHTGHCWSGQASELLAGGSFSWIHADLGRGVPALWWAVQPCSVPHGAILLLSLHRVQRVQAGGNLTFPPGSLLALHPPCTFLCRPLTDSPFKIVSSSGKCSEQAAFSLYLTPFCGYIARSPGQRVFLNYVLCSPRPVVHPGSIRMNCDTMWLPLEMTGNPPFTHSKVNIQGIGHGWAKQM